MKRPVATSWMIGVVLPAVPQAAHDLDDVGGLVEQVVGHDPRGVVRRRPADAAGRPPTWAASAGCDDTRGRQPARPPLTWSRVAMADARWNGSVWVIDGRRARARCGR